MQRFASFKCTHPDLLERFAKIHSSQPRASPECLESNCFDGWIDLDVSDIPRNIFLPLPGINERPYRRRRFFICLLERWGDGGGQSDVAVAIQVLIHLMIIDLRNFYDNDDGKVSALVTANSSRQTR
jgi:hypothetical protein